MGTQAGLGVQRGVAKSQVRHFSQVIDQLVRAFLKRPRQKSGYAYVDLDAIC